MHFPGCWGIFTFYYNPGVQFLRRVSGDLTDIEAGVLIRDIRDHETPVVGVTEQG